MIILFVVCTAVVFGVAPYFAVKSAYKGDYPNRAMVEKAIRERKAEREGKRGAK